jgi:hypothetical protein
METLKTKKVSMVLQFFNEGLIICFNYVFCRGQTQEPLLFFGGIPFLWRCPTAKRMDAMDTGTFFWDYSSFDSS